MWLRRFRDRTDRWTTYREDGRSRPMVLDPSAPSASRRKPAFMAPPAGSPAYHGFVVLEESSVDGFMLGMVTDFGAPPDNWGDGFVVAPDGSRAGLTWESEVDESYIEELFPPDDDTWGVWGVGSRSPLRSNDDARDYLASILDDLHRQWDAWTERRSRP